MEDDGLMDQLLHSLIRTGPRRRTLAGPGRRLNSRSESARTRSRISWSVFRLESRLSEDTLPGSGGQVFALAVGRMGVNADSSVRVDLAIPLQIDHRSQKLPITNPRPSRSGRRAPAASCPSRWGPAEHDVIAPACGRHELLEVLDDRYARGGTLQAGRSPRRALARCHRRSHLR